MIARRLVAATLVLALGGGCALGPDYARPPVDAPAEFRGQVGTPEATSLADLPWWDVFEDEVLQQLIVDALEANFDLATAVHRVEQAKAQLGVAQSPFYPQIQYQGSAGRQRQPELLGTPAATFDLFYGAFSLAWEIDVWGRIRRSSEAAREQLFATEEFRRGVMLTLATTVAEAYLGLLELDRELEITRETVKSFEETLLLFTRQYQGGVGNKLEVERAAAALAQTQAQVPDLERRIVAQENAIQVLLGKSPGAVSRGIPLADRPAPPDTPPGLPSALLERRPDVLQAEHTIASANALVGVAITNFFPQIGLTALYGGQSTELVDIVKGSFSLWNLAGNAAGPLFQGFELLEQYRAQVAVWEQAKAQYEQTVVQAFAEVSDALTAQQKLALARAAQERAVHAFQESVRLALLRYRQGLSNYYEVLEAQQQLYPAEIALAQVQQRQLVTVVTLYRTLGGGWQLTDTQWIQRP
ncbi:MAG: efflux transporter outer membrane subunit [Deltaproteobacteria bacterium]|nr:efflux transporter outer membrane subunit [Deltaproteobacteria bacterium]